MKEQRYLAAVEVKVACGLGLMLAEARNHAYAEEGHPGYSTHAKLSF